MLRQLEPGRSVANESVRHLGPRGVSRLFDNREGEKVSLDTLGTRITW